MVSQWSGVHVLLFLGLRALGLHNEDIVYCVGAPHKYETDHPEMQPPMPWTSGWCASARPVLVFHEQAVAMHKHWTNYAAAMSVMQMTPMDLAHAAQSRENLFLQLLTPLAEKSSRDPQEK